MTDPTFDVHLTGATDASPSAQMRMTATIAARYRLSAPAVAAALAGTPFRVAERLPRREAQGLVDALLELGAVTRLSPAGVPLAANPRTSDDSMSVPRKDFRITLKSADTHAAVVVDVAEPIDFAEPGPDGRTGVRGADTARCSIHGLVYNRRQASGCIRCLAPARAQARKLEEATEEAEQRRGRLADSPIRRAFWGLALALILGFLSAAYYARTSNRHDIIALRAQQAEISLLPATKTTLARFDDLDAAVHAMHRRGAGRALLIWMAVAAVTGAAWTKLT